MGTYGTYHIGCATYRPHRPMLARLVGRVVGVAPIRQWPIHWPIGSPIRQWPHHWPHGHRWPHGIRSNQTIPTTNGPNGPIGPIGPIGPMGWRQWPHWPHGIDPNQPSQPTIHWPQWPIGPMAMGPIGSYCSWPFLGFWVFRLTFKLR